MADFEDMMMRRLDRLETMVGSFSTAHIKADLQDAIDAARGNDKAALQRLADEVRELRAQLTAVNTRAVSKADVAATVSKATRSTAEMIAGVVAQETVALEQRTDDAVRGVKRDVSIAVDAAAASIKSAEALLSRYAEKLGS